MLRGLDVQQLMEMKREGLSTQAISKLTGYDRKTVVLRKNSDREESR